MSEKPACRMSEIPASVLADLNSGRTETRNLVEGLAIDFTQLLRSAAPELKKATVPAVGLLQRTQYVAGLLRERFGIEGYDRFSTHPSDTVRGWAAYIVGHSEELSFAQKLLHLRRLADDPHFGVREWAWLALRPNVVAAPEKAVERLSPWTTEDSANIRRFASEITRPRGVWCSHIPLLREQPEIALPILEPLKSDKTKYVQDSIANWLNDAGKSQPKWVKALCKRWNKESRTPATERIVKRALRNL